MAVRHDGREPSKRRELNSCASVAVIDEHDAIHAAVELWCSQAQPRFQFAGNYFSAEQFLAEHASSAASNVGAVVLELQMGRYRVDFSTLDHLVARQFRVIVYSHIATDEVILTSLDRGAVTYLVKTEGKGHLIDAIRAARTDVPYVGPRMAEAMINDSAVGRPSARTCSGFGQSMPRSDARRRQRRRWSHAQFRTASSTSTTSS